MSFLALRNANLFTEVLRLSQMTLILSMAVKIGMQCAYQKLDKKLSTMLHIQVIDSYIHRR